jgi:tetratricopeptide (TPR) repeat protein
MMAGSCPESRDRIATVGVQRRGAPGAVPWLAGLLLISLVSPALSGTVGADLGAPLDRAMSAAESGLREEEWESAESRYRDALMEGWLLMGSLEAADGRLPQAREAFRHASTVAVETERALRSIGLLDTTPGAPSPLRALTAEERHELRARATAGLARAYLNLGVMQAQGERFDRAAELFAAAAEIDPEFPQIQYSLGVARFNARQFDRAAEPLSRALAAHPENATLKSMLAMAWVNTEAYDKAADLLRGDPERNTNSSLQYTYGLALVRSDRAAEAEQVFSRLLREHGDSAELSVMLGQAYAKEGDYVSAIESLQRALHLKPEVAEANATLGVMYLKQGRLAEAEAALRAEVKGQPADVKSEHNLATVLDLEGRTEEALPLLRSALRLKPDFADARYLLGKILLAQGDAAAAVEHLEAAVRLAPKEANTHYQLAQAYQRLGRAEPAQEQFEVFRELKEKRRGGEP